jgi:hypothetical protein
VKVKKYAFVLLASLVALGTGTQVFAQCEQTYSSSCESDSAPHATVLDSWMEPSVVRTRQLTDANGDKQSVSEPIIMERHERVAFPQREEISTIRETKGARIVSSEESMSSSRQVRHFQPVHRHYVARHYRPATIAHNYTVKRVATASVPTREFREEHRVVERAVLMDRKDPALQMY